jgi:hypothetical protein
MAKFMNYSRLQALTVFFLAVNAFFMTRFCFPERMLCSDLSKEAFMQVSHAGILIMFFLVVVPQWSKRLDRYVNRRMRMSLAGDAEKSAAAKKDAKFNVEAYLHDKLEDRQKNLGVTGGHKIKIASWDSKNVLVQINNLTKEKAREIFDIIDENNSVHGDASYRLSIYNEQDQELDYNRLPNAFSDLL